MFSRMFAREPSGRRQSEPKGASALGPTAHVDTFARDSLPPAAQ